MKKAERAAAMVWAMARRAGVFGPKPESLLFSEASSSLYIPPSPTLFRVKDHWKRIGLVYWVQRRRYWTMKRFRRDLAVGQPIPIPTVGEMLEEKLRKRVYRLGRPRPLERVLYRLDRDGVFCP